MYQKNRYYANSYQNRPQCNIFWSYKVYGNECGMSNFTVNNVKMLKGNLKKCIVRRICWCIEQLNSWI